MSVTTHMCRGNFRSSWAAEGGYDFVAEALFNGLEVDGFFLEYDDERSGTFEPLRFVPKGKQVVLGLVTTKRGDARAEGRAQAPDRGGVAVRPARPALPLAAVRLLVDGRGERAVARRADREAPADRRDGGGGLGISGADAGRDRRSRSRRARPRSAAAPARESTRSSSRTGPVSTSSTGSGPACSSRARSTCCATSASASGWSARGSSTTGSSCSSTASGHRIDFPSLTGGRRITVYGQQEVVKDLIAARLETGRPLLFEVDDVRLEGLEGEEPAISFRARRRGARAASATSSPAATASTGSRGTASPRACSRRSSGTIRSPGSASSPRRRRRTRS